MKFLVKYELPYIHTVVFGVEADNAEAAKERAQAAFDEGTIWDNTAAMPLLHDTFDEGTWDGGEGPAMEFTAQALPEGEDFPVTNGPIMVPGYHGYKVINFDGAWE